MNAFEFANLFKITDGREIVHDAPRFLCKPVLSSLHNQVRRKLLHGDHNPVHLTSIVLGMRGLPLELGNLSNTLMAYRNGLIPGIDILFCQIQGKIC